MNSTKSDAPHAFRPAGSLEIYTAEETRRAILEHLLANRELVIDLSAVEACDTAGLQLLCSAAASAAQAGKPFRLDNIPGAVLERWNGLGLPASFLTTAKA